MDKAWEVRISVGGDEVLVLSSGHVCGLSILDEYEEAIREAAESVLAFIGKDGYATFVPDRSEGESE